jgi:tetratricopeptide (TPR) repeat protein
MSPAAAGQRLASMVRDLSTLFLTSIFCLLAVQASRAQADNSGLPIRVSNTPSQGSLKGSIATASSAPAKASLRIHRPNITQLQPSTQVKNLLKGGIEKHKRGDDKGAEHDFKEALNIDPGNANGHFNLAVLEEARGESSSALEDYRDALRANPGDQSIIAAISQLENAQQSQPVFQEKHIFEGRALQNMFTPSPGIIASQSEYPPLAPMRGTLNSRAFIANANINSAGHNTLAVATTAQQTEQSGTMHALRSIGMGVFHAALSSSHVDMCACPILHF